MFKTTLGAVATGAALFAGALGSANALELTAGNYKIIFDNYDAGTLNYSRACGGATVAAGIADCDAAAVGTAPGAGGTSIDTQGILSVASISNIATGQDQYVRGSTSVIGGITFGPFLTGVFTGLTDYKVQQFVDPGDGTLITRTFSTGGTFSIYSNPANYDPTRGPTGAGVNLPAGIYPSITPGSSLFLGGVFAPGVVAGDGTTNYLTRYDSAAISGNGQGYLDFTGGIARSFFDTNAMAGGRDAFLTVTFDDANRAASNLGWSVKSSGQISGLLLPEPDSLALFALALLALGATVRRSGKKA